MTRCSDHSYFLVPQAPYSFAVPPVNGTQIIIGDSNIIETAGTNIVLPLSNLQLGGFETSVSLHYLSRGILKVYDFVNNNNGTGSITVDVAPNFSTVLIILVTTNASGAFVNVGYKSLICKEEKELVGTSFIIYPKFYSESFLYYSLLSNIPTGTFYNINNPYTVPYIKGKTTFVLEVKEVGVPVLINITPQNKNYAPKQLRIIPNQLQEEIQVHLEKDTSDITIVSGTSTYKTRVSALHLSTFLNAYAQDIYSYVTRNISINYNSIYSLFSTQLTCNLIESRFQEIIPRDKAHNTVANRLILKSLASTETSKKTVTDTLVACTQNTPLIVPNENDTKIVDPLVNTLFTDSEVMGGNDVYIWSDDYCMVSWELFKKYLNNRGLPIIKGDNYSIIYQDDNDNTQTCYYDLGDNTCSVLDLYDFCYDNIDTDITFDKHTFINVSQNYPLDSVVYDRHAYVQIQDLEYRAKAVGKNGNNISIAYHSSTSCGVSVSGLNIIVTLIPSFTTALNIQDVIQNDLAASALVDVSIIGLPNTLQYAFHPIYLSGGYTDNYWSNNIIKEKHAILETALNEPYAGLTGTLMLETSLPEQNAGDKKVYAGNPENYNLSGTSLILSNFKLDGTTTSTTVVFNANGMTALSTARTINLQCPFVVASVDSGLARLTLTAKSGFLNIDKTSTALSVLGNFVLYDSILFAGEVSVASAINTIYTQGTYVTAQGYTRQIYTSENAEPYATVPWAVTGVGINGIINKTLYAEVYDNTTGLTTVEKVYFDTFVPSPSLPGGAGAGNTYTVAVTASAVSHQINTQTTTLYSEVDAFNHVVIKPVSGTSYVIKSIFGDALSALGNFYSDESEHYVIIHSLVPGHISDTTTMKVFTSGTTPAVLTALGLVGGQTGTTVTTPTYPKTSAKEKYDILEDCPYLAGAPLISRFDGGVTLDNFISPSYRYPFITSILPAPFYGLRDRYLNLDIVKSTGELAEINIHFDPLYHPAGTPVSYRPFSQDVNTITEVVDYLNYMSNENYGGVFRAYKVNGNRVRIETHQPNNSDELIIRERSGYVDTLLSWGFASYYSNNKDMFNLSGHSLTITILSNDNVTTSNSYLFSAAENTTTTVVSSMNQDFTLNSFPCSATNINGHVVLFLTNKDWNVISIVETPSTTGFGDFTGGILSETKVISPPVWKGGPYVGSLNCTEMLIPTYTAPVISAICTY